MLERLTKGVRPRLPELSNSGCLPGRAGGSPGVLEDPAHSQGQREGERALAELHDVGEEVGGREDVLRADAGRPARRHEVVRAEAELGPERRLRRARTRSEEHTSESSHTVISY